MWKLLSVFSFLFVLALAAEATESTKNLSVACEDQLQQWMQGVPIRVHPGNATLTVDWTDLDAKLVQLGCSYDQLWLELWRVSKIPENDNNFGSPDYFSKYERCNELNEQHFSYHSTRTHSGLEGPTTTSIITSKQGGKS